MIKNHTTEAGTNSQPVPAKQPTSGSAMPPSQPTTPSDPKHPVVGPQKAHPSMQKRRSDTATNH